jgi:hypothetical protein
MKPLLHERHSFLYFTVNLKETKAVLSTVQEVPSIMQEGYFRLWVEFEFITLYSPN